MAIPAPRVFISYSPSKSLDPEGLKQFVEVVKGRIIARHWHVADPMVSTDVEQISRKIHEAIFSSDALIAECTTGAPNVMYEIGAMRGLGRTVILGINPDPLLVDEERRKYLAFYGLSSSQPIASDLGDIEYLRYRDLSQSENRAELCTKLDELLKKLESSKLKSGSRLLQHKFYSFVPIVNNFAVASPPDHPLPVFVAGWLSGLHDSFRRETESVFEIDSDYYAACLAEFQRHGSQSTRAVADLSDNTETFWKEDPTPSSTRVDERIFLIPWEIVFNESRFSRIAGQLSRHANNYTVRLGLSQFSWPTDDGHPLDKSAIGKHLLLVEPDLVGGYVRRGENTYLRLERNEAKYKRSERAYTRAKELSFVVRNTASLSDVTAEMRRLFRFGIWDEEWADDIEGRGSNYIDLYDLHIRCWIPKYEQLIDHCCFEVKSAVDFLLKNRAPENESLRILEIGVGTGAVTVPMALWVDLCNAPYRDAGVDVPIHEYVGVDKDERMVDITKRKVGSMNSVTIQKGTAPAGLGNLVRSRRQFDVIVGSLVLHDILGRRDSTHLVQTLRKFRSLLSPNGVLIFADIFPDANSSIRAQQIEYWRLKMRQSGLDQAQIDFFFLRNPEMLTAPSDSALAAAAESELLDLKEIGMVPGGDPSSPFRVVRLDRVE